MPSVSINKLVKKYGSAVAVEEFNLEVNDGELVVLLGPSGCGKTTTLRCIAGLEDISDGEILIGDRVVSSRSNSVPPEKRKIGMVFQSYAIWPHMSVRDNVGYGLKAAGIKGDELHGRVERALDMVSLGGFGDRGASQLSGGQQQRVALARAAVMEPEILLFDEPLSNLDARLRERMRFELRDLQKRLGITAVYVTHDQQEAMALADRIVLMNKGVMAQVGPPKEIYEQPGSVFAAEFVGQANLVSGRVVGSNGTLTGEGGLEIHFQGDSTATGDTGTAVIRPERIRVSIGKPDGPNVFSGVVVSSAYLGNLGEYVVRTGGTDLTVQSSPPGEWQAGQELWLAIDPRDVRIIPARN